MTYFWDNGRRMKLRGKYSMMALRGTLGSNSKNNTMTFDNVFINNEQRGDLSERSSRRRRTSNEVRHNSIRNRLTTSLFPSADSTNVFCDEELVLQALLMRCFPIEFYRNNMINPMKLSNAYQASNEHYDSNLDNMYAHGFEEIQINHILRELAQPFSDLHEAFEDSEDEQKTEVREESDNVDELSSSSFDDEDDDVESGKLTPWYRLPEKRHAVTREEDEKSGYKLDPEVLAEKLNVVLSDLDESDTSSSIKGDEVDSETRSKPSSNAMPLNTLNDEATVFEKRVSEPSARRKSTTRVSSLPPPTTVMPDENGTTGLAEFPFRFKLSPNVSWWQRRRNGYGHPSKKLRAQLNEVKSSIETFIEEYEYIYRQFEEIFKREHSDDPQLRKRTKWRRVPTSRKCVVGGRHVDFERMMELQGDPTKFVDCLPPAVKKTAATPDKVQKPTNCGDGSSRQQLFKTKRRKKVDSVARMSKFTIVGQWKSNSHKGDIDCQIVTNKDVLKIWQDQLMDIIAIKNTTEPEEMQAIFDLYDRYNCLFSFASEFVAHTMLDKWEILNAKRQEFYNHYKKTGKIPVEDVDAKMIERFTHLLDENINFISILLSKDVAPEESKEVETPKVLPWAERIPRYGALSFPDFYFRGNENICYCVSKKPSENEEKNKHRECNCRFLLKTRAYDHPMGLEDFDYRFIPRREFRKLDPQTTKQAIISWTANEDRTREYAKKRVDIALKYWYQKAVHVNHFLQYLRDQIKTMDIIKESIRLPVLAFRKPENLKIENDSVWFGNVPRRLTGGEDSTSCSQSESGKAPRRYLNELFKVMHTRFSLKTIETLRKESNVPCCRSTWYCYNMKELPPSKAVTIFRDSRTYTGRSVKFTPRRILGYRDVCPFCDMILITHHPSLSRFVEYRFKHMVRHMTYRADVESHASKINQQHDCNAPATTYGGGEDHKCHGEASKGCPTQQTGAFPHENCYLHRKVPPVLSIFNGRILTPMEQQKMIEYFKRVDKFEHAMIKTRIMTRLVEGSEELDLLHHKQAFNVQLYEFINEHTTRTIAAQIEKILVNQEMHVKLKREREVKVKFCKRSRDWPLKLASQMNQEELARYLSTNERPAYKTVLVRQDVATRTKEQTRELLPVMHREWLKIYRLMKEDTQQVAKRKKILRKLNDLVSAEEFYSLIAPMSLPSRPAEEANQKLTIK